MNRRKRRIFPALLCAAAVLLQGCAAYPEAADDGAAWDRDWEMLGTVLGVEPPAAFALLENNVVLGTDDTWYATWASGEPRPYINEDGDETDLYPAQLYLLLYGCENAARAEEAAADWIARETETYRVLETRTETHNGHDYTILVYEVLSDANPYQRGISAFGLYAHYAVAAELSCTASFAEDEQAALAAFLDGCHYAAADS